jgi:hypothetical protein
VFLSRSFVAKYLPNESGCPVIGCDIGTKSEG